MVQSLSKSLRRWQTFEVINEGFTLLRTASVSVSSPPPPARLSVSSYPHRVGSRVSRQVRAASALAHNAKRTAKNLFFFFFLFFDVGGENNANVITVS